MIQMEKRYLIPTIFMGIAVGFCLTVPKQTATAAIYVEDIKNIAENAKTAINTYTNAINTAKQVSLMIQDLTSMDPKALIAHYTGLDKEYKIIFISDLHVDNIRSTRYITSVVKELEQQQPDMVLIGGDLLNRAKNEYAKAFLPFNTLSMPIYAVL